MPTAPRPLPVALLGLAASVGLAAAFGWLRWPLTASFGFVPGDDFDVQLTLLEATGRSWRAGVLPAWNPWTAGGTPLLANPESPALHPVGLLAALLPAEAVLRLSVVAHWAVALTGTGLLAGQLAAQAGPRRGGAGLAAVAAVAALCSTDLFVSRAAGGHATMLQAAWIPMAVWAAGRDGARWGPALCVAAALYGGGPQVALFAAGSVGLRLSVEGLTARAAWRRLAEIALLTAALAAPRVAMTAAAMHGLDRFVWPTPTGALAAESLGEALRRVAFGGTLAERPGGGHNGLPALLVPVWPALALVGAWALRRRPAVPVAAALLVVLSLGDLSPLPLYRWLHAVPPLDTLRFPDRLGLAWAPLLCAVGAVGLARLARSWWSQAGAGLLAVGFAAWAVEQHRGPWQIDPWRPLVVAPAEAAPGLPREPLQAPVFVAGRADTNLALLRENASCLGCSDATEVRAQRGRATGAYPLPAGVTLEAWAPGRVTLRVEEAGVVPLPESLRRGWTAEDGDGEALPVSAGPAGQVVVTASAPGPLSLRYRPPGLGWGLLGMAVGVGVVVAWGRRRGGVPLVATPRPWAPPVGSAQQEEDASRT